MKFSVLISVYYKEKSDFLFSALTSIWEIQTLKPDEIVLVKDGSLNEDLDLVISKYLNIAPIKVISLPKNIGLGPALRVGLKNCSNELVIRMDSDDISIEDRFEKQIAFMRANPHISASSGVIQEFYNSPGDLARRRKLPSDYSQLYSFAKKRNPLNHPAVIFRKSHIEQVGSYEDVPFFEDYYLWIKLLNFGYKIANQNQVLLNFRIGKDQIGRRHGFSYIKKEINFFNKMLSLGFISKIEYFSISFKRLPVRFLPKSVLSLFYKLVLR